MFGYVETLGRRYETSKRSLRSLRGPLGTTEACLTEAMYLTGSRIGVHAQERIWDLLRTFKVDWLAPDPSLVQRLMTRYRDVPMDFADATLVALASEDPRVKIATFDSDFLAYRRDDGTPVPLVDDRLLGWEA